jgi:DNA-binding MarR family transcriptional regulator
MLGLMEKAGLVARGERESDRRGLAISLTAKVDAYPYAFWR